MRKAWDIRFILRRAHSFRFCFHQQQQQNFLSQNWPHPPIHTGPQVINHSTQHRSVVAQRISLCTLDAAPRFHCCKPIPPSPCKISASNQATGTSATGGAGPYHPTHDGEQPQKLRRMLTQRDSRLLRCTVRHLEYKGNINRIVSVQGAGSRVHYAHNLNLRQRQILSPTKRHIHRISHRQTLGDTPRPRQHLSEKGNFLFFGHQ